MDIVSIQKKVILEDNVSMRATSAYLAIAGRMRLREKEERDRLRGRLRMLEEDGEIDDPPASLPAWDPWAPRVPAPETYEYELSDNEKCHTLACWIGSRPEETRADLEAWIPGLVELSRSDPARFQRLYVVWHRCASRLWQPGSHDERTVMVYRVASRTREARSEIDMVRNTSDAYKAARWSPMGGKGSSRETRTDDQQARRDEYNAAARERVRAMRARKREQAALMALPEAAE